MNFEYTYFFRKLVRERINILSAKDIKGIIAFFYISRFTV
jgi:hypothetical protein